MQYNRIHKARFLSRPNRFIAECEIDGEKQICHVKNTGRCRELLVDGATVYLDEPQGNERKTKYDLVAVEKVSDAATLLINMDSQAPNEAAAEFLRSHPDLAGASIRREVTKGNSRFDFCIESEGKTTFLEVKGVTLEKDGIAMFPDAPTERGIKHIEELIELKKQGFGAAILFVSKGTPFVQAGEEMLRTKPLYDKNDKLVVGDYDENSYSSCDETNNLKWNTLSSTSEEYKLMKYYQGLVQMRKAYSIFSDVNTTVNASKLGSAGWAVTYKNGNQEAVVLINASGSAANYTMPGGSWKLVATIDKAGAGTIDTQGAGNVSVPAGGILVYVK